MSMTKEQKNALADLREAVAFATARVGSIFGGSPTDEQVIGIAIRCGDYDEEGRNIVCEDLTASVILARDVFATVSPTTKQVFMVFDSVFAEDEEE